MNSIWIIIANIKWIMAAKSCAALIARLRHNYRNSHRSAHDGQLRGFITSFRCVLLNAFKCFVAKNAMGCICVIRHKHGRQLWWWCPAACEAFNQFVCVCVHGMWRKVLCIGACADSDVNSDPLPAAWMAETLRVFALAFGLFAWLFVVLRLSDI